MKVEDLLLGPNDAVKEAILSELGEDSERLASNLKLLEKWMDCHDYLPKNYDKRMLSICLRNCKHDVQRTKESLERYFVARTRNLDLFGNRRLSLEHDLNATNCVNVLPLPEMTREGHRITLVKLLKPNFEDVSYVDFARYVLILSEIGLHLEPMLSGSVMVFDSTNFSMAHVAGLLSPTAKRLFDILQKSFRFRVKQIHIIANSPAAQKGLAWLKLTLSSKLNKRIYVHNNRSSLSEFFPAALLPADYGGEQKSSQELMDDWNGAIVNLSDWFRQLDEMKIDAPISKHLEAANGSDGFGLDGSFRRLNID